MGKHITADRCPGRPPKNPRSLGGSFRAFQRNLHNAGTQHRLTRGRPITDEDSEP